VAEVKPPAVGEIQNVRHPVQIKNKCVLDNCPSPNNVCYGRGKKWENSDASIFFYYVLIKYKNNFTLLPDNLLERRKKLCVFEYSC